MTYTLLMRLTGPMQAWGLQSRFSIRDTAREPTKSGVLGLVCAALGRPRAAPLDDLAALRMGVRVDREGQMRRDFHTAQDIVKASATIRPGKPIPASQRKVTEPSVRHYLADAWFTIGLTSDNQMLLEEIDQALGNPRWPLFLGRKAFPPGLPPRIMTEGGEAAGLVPAPLVAALTTFQDPLFTRHDKKPIRVVLDADVPHNGLQVVAERMQPDQPVSFQPRRFLPREVLVGYIKPQSKHVSL